MVVLAIDMGGTKIAVARCDAKGKIQHQEEFATPRKATTNQLLDAIEDALLAVAKEYPVHRVGWSFPGYADEKGEIVFAGGFLTPLEGENLISFTKEIFGRVKVVVLNDADAFAYAEHVCSKSSAHEYTLGIIWGSGVGVGLVTGTKAKPEILHEGRIELGHQPIIYQGGTWLSVEQCAGGRSLQNMYHAITGKLISVKHLYDTRETDVVAGQIINRALDAMAAMIATAILAYDPDRIVLGGGVSHLPVVQELKKRVGLLVPKEFVLPEIRKYYDDPGAGLQGAAWWVINR